MERRASYRAHAVKSPALVDHLDFMKMQTTETLKPARRRIRPRLQILKKSSLRPLFGCPELCLPYNNPNLSYYPFLSVLVPSRRSPDRPTFPHSSSFFEQLRISAGDRIHLYLQESPSLSTLLESHDSMSRRAA